MATQHGLEYIKLADVTVPTSVIELVPESVARENAILPLGEDDGQLRVVVSDPDDFETFEKLRFILNRPIIPVIAPRDMIVEAINRHSGQTVGESADTMLQEFTDTAIDFTEAEEQRLSGQEQIDESAAPIVRLVHLISEAVNLRPTSTLNRLRTGFIRYRIDGMLVERDNPEKTTGHSAALRFSPSSTCRAAPDAGRADQDHRQTRAGLGERHPDQPRQSVVMRILTGQHQDWPARTGLDETPTGFKGLIARPNGIIP